MGGLPSKPRKASWSPTRMSRGGVTMVSAEVPSQKRYAVDTSVAVAALDAAHTSHAPCRDAARTYRPALAGHAAYEVYSVLTRMPGQLAVAPDAARQVIRAGFPEVVSLVEADAADLLDRVGVLGITGGGVYDALVAQAAHRHGRVLLTRDRRAMRTYDLLGVEYLFIGV